ncbi:MAG: acetyl-CoA carboxylase biotin carboxylase subunit [Candidatus Stahlbacteria bacterium]|nr:acetyl-CoA carboxylase biotin carboxylase subunit [Candidatus Stahlbacteria bacterium]
MFNKILIANRGEIAVRIIRACKELGISPVAVYSEADRGALHMRYADEVYSIGASPATDSYLKMAKIIEVAKQSGADAIHPGYGFLAENTEFAERCEAENIIFIGPSSKAIKLLGDKIESRKTMEKVGIPVVPGTVEPIQELPLDRVMEIADNIGFPVLIKASGGGGGKGMRIVKEKTELQKSLTDASREANSSFGNPTIYIEKYLESPRHIEFQILADNYGNVIHLGERECSVQRRYQKLIEESPSPIMTPELRDKMGAIAVRAVKVSGYTNAGTVEFMVESQKNFYFLEMNTRLQVEHPITELITGIDIVKEQIRIASGEKLRIKQSEVKLMGAAIECRISAEDPDNNFVPSTGKIVELIEPSGPGVRIDSGICNGFTVPIYYDPLIAKLLVWAPTRAEAITRMRRALTEYKIIGIRTGIPFHKLALMDVNFIKGDYDTSFVSKLLTPEPLTQNAKIAAIAGTIVKSLKEEKVRASRQLAPTGSYDPWKVAARQAGLRK